MIQLVAGMGGIEKRSGTFSQFPFVAAGFSLSTKPVSRFGFAQIDVTPTQLTIKYIAADDGSIIDQFTIVDSPLPHISITAVDSDTREQGSNPGVFSVSRTGSTVDPMTIGYTLGGTAQNGSDYALLSGTITIPVGQASANIVLTPLNDTLPEGSEVVSISLAPLAAYIIDGSGTSSVTIVDNETVATTFTQITDTYLHQITSNTNFGQAVSLTVDGENNGGQVQALVRFDNLFGIPRTRFPWGLFKF